MEISPGSSHLLPGTIRRGKWIVRQTESNSIGDPPIARQDSQNWFERYPIEKSPLNSHRFFASGGGLASGWSEYPPDGGIIHEFFRCWSANLQFMHFLA
jgi:hypothetical protein